IAGMFRGSHHRLMFSDNGKDAVAKAESLKPDVIFLDLRMPGMDGREVLAKIRETAGLELLPIIATTASSLLDEENHLKERFSGYVRKPFSKHQLFDELAQFLPPDPQAPSFDLHQPPATTKRPARKSTKIPSELAAHLRHLLVEK